MVVPFGCKRTDRSDGIAPDQRGTPVGSRL